MPSAVAAIPAAPSAEAEAHFAASFAFETDCWDVHEAMKAGPDFVLLDVRGPDSFARGHVAGAVHNRSCRAAAWQSAPHMPPTITLG